MKSYVGVRQVQAAPMMLSEYFASLEGEAEEGGWDGHEAEGYLIIHPDGWQGWEHKAKFEDSHLQTGPNNTIIEQNVNDFIKSYEVTQWGDKTTVVHATLANGFIVSDSSSCVDPTNFNLDIGADICKDRIRNKVWHMLGFLLQCGVSGVVSSKDGE